MQEQAKGIIERIKQVVIDAPWIGSDETTTKVAGKRFWEWVWQSPRASYYVISQSRGYRVIKEHFAESYRGVICHDCWFAQNKTPAGRHQLCHAHLLRNLQYAIDKERSVWAYRVQRLLRKSQRAREKIWQAGVSPKLREATIQYYKKALDALNQMPLNGTEERRLQKRLVKHKDWIFTFMDYIDVPPDNNSSERAIKAAKLKDPRLWGISFCARSYTLCSTPFLDSNLTQAETSDPCLLDCSLQWQRCRRFLSIGQQAVPLCNRI
jgi:hypothetical protein